MELGLHDAALLGSSVTTNESGVAVEVLGNFLEGSVLRLDVEEVDEDKFEGEPDTLLQNVRNSDQVVIKVQMDLRRRCSTSRQCCLAQSG